jgi:signal transduction histidine kinase
MKNRLRSISLFQRIFLMIVTSSVIMLVGFAILGIQAVNDSTERTLQERSTLAEAVAGRVDDRLNEAINEVQVMIESQHLDPSDPDQAVQQHNLTDIKMHLGDFADWVALVNVDRQFVTAYPLTDDVKVFDFTNAKCVQYVFDNQHPVISCAFRLGSANPIVAMVVPIFKEGKLNGLVFTALNLSSPQFTQILQPLGLGSSGYVEVIDNNGLILGSTRPELLWQQDDHQGQIAALIQRKTATVSTCHSCHTEGTTSSKSEDIMAFAPLTAAKWGVALRQSRNEAFTYSDTLQQRAIFLGAVAFLIVAITTWLMARQWVRPLQGLTQACDEIAQGNLAIKIPSNGVGEIQVLARAFDFMRQQLQASLAKIQGWTAELEERVRQRTKELENSQVQLVEANRELSTLNAIGDALVRSLDLETTLDLALESVVRLGDVWGATICLLKRNDNQFVPIPHHSIHLNGQCACEWEPVRAVIPQTFREQQARVIQVPIMITADNKIEMREGVPTHPVVCVPLVGKNRNLGMMILINPSGHSFASSEVNLLTSIGVQIGIAVENALLFDTLREKEEARSELLRKVIVAQEDERRRIARELHDETSQALTALNVGLKTAIMAPASSPDDVKRRLAPLKTQASGMLEEIQRMIRDLRPSLLDDLGLVSAIDWYAEARLKTENIQVEWEIVGTERRLSPELETTLFRVAQEAISNIARHAHAENVSIVLGFEDKMVTLEVEDDGKGFVPGESLSAIRAGGAYGLLGMRERIGLLGGELLIESQIGEGTRIQVKIPSESRQDNETTDQNKTASAPEQWHSDEVMRTTLPSRKT